MRANGIHQVHSGAGLFLYTRELGRVMRTIFWGGARAVSVCDALGDLLVPLLLGLAIEKPDNGHGHVVAADTARFRV